MTIIQDGKSVAEAWVVLLLAVIFTLLLSNVSGSYDMRIWTNWVTYSELVGIQQGFAASTGDNYPPLSIVLLHYGARIFQQLGAEVTDAIRYVLLLFLLGTCAVFWRWTRNARLALGLYVALLIGTAIGYLDVLFAPAFLLALWALERRRLMLFAVLLSLSIFSKWQPLIIAPFFLLHLLGICSIRQCRAIPISKLLVTVVLPACVVVLGICMVFGVGHVLKSFGIALNNTMLSGNALNLAWLETWWLHVTQPDMYGYLQDGAVTFIYSTDRSLMLPLKLLFATVFFIIIALYWRQEKTFTHLLQYAVLGSVAYCVLTTGVHENHWFLPLLLCFALYAHDRTWQLPVLLLAVMHNLNIMLFYGLDGVGLTFSRVIAGMDLSVPLAGTSVLLLVLVWRRVCART